MQHLGVPPKWDMGRCEMKSKMVVVVAGACLITIGTFWIAHHNFISGEMNREMIEHLI